MGGAQTSEQRLAKKVVFVLGVESSHNRLGLAGRERVFRETWWDQRGLSSFSSDPPLSSSASAMAVGVLLLLTSTLAKYPLLSLFVSVCICVCMNFVQCRFASNSCLTCVKFCEYG